MHLRVYQRKQTPNTNGKYYQLLFLPNIFVTYYERLVNQCVNFLIGNSLIKKREDFVCANAPENAPLFITAWIMNQ